MVLSVSSINGSSGTFHTVRSNTTTSGAVDGSGRPGMGSGLVRTVQVGSGLRVDMSRCD